MKTCFSTSNIKLSAIAGFAGDLLSKDQTERKKAINNYLERIKFCAELEGIGVISVPTFGQGVYEVYANQNFSEVYPGTSKILGFEKNHLLESYKLLGKYAEEYGVFIIIEPLNRYETRFLQKLEHATEICRLVGKEKIRIMADFYHMNIEENNISNSLRAAAEYLVYIHLADSNRLLPGMGHIDFAEPFATLTKIGFNNFLSIESAIMGNPKIELGKCINFLESF